MLLEKLQKWKKSTEIKGLKVKASKAMRCRVSKCQVEASGRDPCSVCRNGSWSQINLKLCMECHSWGS